ncbi:MAG: peptidoglycan DD-metalloendopeptidase family protein [Methyloceanibacter sp.]|uniref:peptidoglycan DD-metalloendopeptidase family protein n=1 Tax=Methyloceanibacter sp. TaxID=1965321 RepID=UPI001D8A21BD|nr:peptidoglycan DD-metalloendopeptidase family protein [Methyloceanibacter sp.]MCB1441516.1 peptidoglycan DD-metalloendopeptidase family protein [Methyloceanibacter sp.]
MLKRRGGFARRKLGQALVPATPRGLPTIFLGELPSSKIERELPPVYLCESSHEGPAHRLKWMASTCLAGMVGVCLIGVAIYASMNMSDGSGMVNSIKRASLAALQPIRGARLAQDAQSVGGQKEDRIQMTSAGFASRQVIHDTIVQRQGDREFITIKPYLRVIAGLATEKPEDASRLPTFNPFKLYSDATPIGGGQNADDPSLSLQVNMIDVPGGLLPATDDIELEPEQVDGLVASAADNFSYAETPVALGETSGEATLQLASYRPGEAERPRILPNTTVMRKVADEDGDFQESQVANAETKVITVGRSDTLLGVMQKVGASKELATELIDSLDAVFGPEDLKPKQKIDFRLVESLADSDVKEPVRVSIFDADGNHIVTTSRNRDGDYLASTTAPADDVVVTASNRASLYESFYESALKQKLPPDIVLKLLRVHSYDVDFKQKVHPGDTFEVFFEGEGTSGDEAGELLYTSMTVAGETRKFYRFRTPDNTVDFYDENGSSAKKFLMRNPVKGGRFTSGFGNRRHPLLRRIRMHTGVDWAAPIGTPILAAGDGTIEMAERHGGYGNYIRIRHANGFATAYGHMTRFAAGSKPGARVKQGQIIGYVGTTGRSTGPHLHYEVLVNNKFVNPMTIAVPRGLKLEGRNLAAFEKERRRIDALMELDPVTSRVAQAQVE